MQLGPFGVAASRNISQEEGRINSNNYRRIMTPKPASYAPGPPPASPEPPWEPADSPQKKGGMVAATGSLCVLRSGHRWRYWVVTLLLRLASLPLMGSRGRCTCGQRQDPTPDVSQGSIRTCRIAIFKLQRKDQCYGRMERHLSSTC